MSAVEYARSVERGEASFAWSDLERSAFSAHPDAAPKLDSSNRDLRQGPSTGLWAALAIGGFILTFWPVIALGLIVSSLRLDSGVAVCTVIAGIGALAFIVLRVVFWIRSASRDEDASPREAVLMAISTLLGVPTIVLAYPIAVQGWAPLGWLWFWTFVAATIVSAVSFVLLVRRGRAVRAGARVAGSPFDEARGAIDALPAAERERIRVDLDQAIALLVAAGVISPEYAAEVGQAPLGGLARRAWALERAAR